MQTAKNPRLSALKLTAAVLVYMCHAYMQGNASYGAEIRSDGLFFLLTPAWAGVWIFFIISGYLAGRAFLGGRRSLTVGSAVMYCAERYIKVVVPALITICFIYMMCYPKVFFVDAASFITCSYNGLGGLDGISALWYVFTLMKLYLFTPAVCAAVLAARRLKRYPAAVTAAFLLTAAAGLAYRLYALREGVNWYINVYANVRGNLDLFIGGILINGTEGLFEGLRGKKTVKISAEVLFAGFILFNTAVFYSAYKGRGELYDLYRYYFPTVYLLLTAVCIGLTADEKGEGTVSTVLNGLADISYPFYLWHTIILERLSVMFAGEDPFASYLGLTAAAAAVCLITAWAAGKTYGAVCGVLMKALDKAGMLMGKINTRFQKGG